MLLPPAGLVFLWVFAFSRWPEEQAAKQESIYVFDQARGYMLNVITNSLVGAAYSDLTISIGNPVYNAGNEGSDVANTSSTE